MISLLKVSRTPVINRVFTHPLPLTEMIKLQLQSSSQILEIFPNGDDRIIRCLGKDDYGIENNPNQNS
jgi:hypothetical protein